MISRPLLRYFGGKWRLAPWIISHFPNHACYTEAFGGGASVLLRKTKVIAEVYNDLDSELVNLFKVARERGAELRQLLFLTPYSREEFNLSYKPSLCDLEQARRTIVRSYMGFGSTMTRRTREGRLMRTGFRAYSKKNRRSIPAADWANYALVFDRLIERLRGVVIENRPALEILKKHDGPQTLHYVDPCYLHELRGRSDGYGHEMNQADHELLLDSILKLSGMVVLSGYDSRLYDSALQGWKKKSLRTMADGARPRTECLWLSPKTVRELSDFPQHPQKPQ